MALIKKQLAKSAATPPPTGQHIDQTGLLTSSRSVAQLTAINDQQQGQIAGYENRFNAISDLYQGLLSHPYDYNSNIDQALNTYESLNGNEVQDPSQKAPVIGQAATGGPSVSSPSMTWIIVGLIAVAAFFLLKK